jgi:hypothetical protein
MSIAAGGLISQKIYIDTKKLEEYNTENYESCKLNLVNAYLYNKLTGFPLQPTPISVQTYMNYGYPWYELYDLDKKAVAENDTSMFKMIESVSKFEDEEEDCCICEEIVANIEFEPCGHKICSECVTKMTKVSEIFEKTSGKVLEKIDKTSLFQCHLCRGEIKSDQVKITSGVVSSLGEFEIPLVPIKNKMLLIHIN